MEVRGKQGFGESRCGALGAQQGADEIGRGTAAAAQERGAGIPQGCVVGSEELRRGVIAQGTTLDGGQARVGLDPEGEIAGGAQPPADGHSLFNTYAAICAYGISAC